MINYIKGLGIRTCNSIQKHYRISNTWECRQPHFIKKEGVCGLYVSCDTRKHIYNKQINKKNKKNKK